MNVTSQIVELTMYLAHRTYSTDTESKSYCNAQHSTVIIVSRLKPRQMRPSSWSGSTCCEAKLGRSQCCALKPCENAGPQDGEW